MSNYNTLQSLEGIVRKFVYYEDNWVEESGDPDDEENTRKNWLESTTTSTILTLRPSSCRQSP